MHELGITQQLVAIACERAEGAKVRRVVVEIGKLSAVMPDAVRFCFPLCCEGTVAEGATLDIVEKPGIAKCRSCGGKVVLERPFGQCVCGCTELEWLSGEELCLREMEVV